MEVFVIEIHNSLAGHPRRRGVCSHDLFDGLVRKVGVRREQLPLTGVLHHRLHREPKLVSRRVHSTKDEEAQRIAEFVITQTVSVAIGFDELRHQIVARVRLAIGDESLRVSIEFVERFFNSGEFVLDGDSERETDCSRDTRDSRPFAFGYSREDAQHAGRVGFREVVDKFKLAPVKDGIDEFRGEFLKLWDVGLNMAERERRVEHPSDSTVVIAFQNQEALRPPVVKKSGVDSVVVRPLAAALAQPVVLE
ncbi:unannotated protein [freshwater metagenome]|uniref:Unannotated protein n=1 Tax=freshwater metagenome TaxID=449393 RepID=A0A6J6FS78_9ZZZZ